MAGLAHLGQPLSGQAALAIVGAGYAGLAAAVELAQSGIPVDVFEAAPGLGGRARAVALSEAQVDNGQHILLGAYHQTLRLLRLLGAEQDLLRLPLTLVFPGQVSIRAWPLPAPLHLAAALITARGLSWPEKWAALTFMRQLAGCAYQLAADCSVAELLEARRQPPRLQRYLWQPLCLAALNTPPETASAQVFVNVLRDTLAGGRAASQMLLPRVDLSALLPDRAEAYLLARGSRVLLRARVRSISGHEQGFQLSLADGSCAIYRQVIVAVAPWHAPALLENFAALAPLRQQISAMAWEPIVTCYLAYGPGLRLTTPMLGQVGGHLQWLFDRGQLGGPEGLLAAVISAGGAHQGLSNAELARAVHGEIATMVPQLPAPLWAKLIREQRASFACTPGLKRPVSATAVPGLLLAGDYVASDYPATLEAAVASGVAAARLASGREPTADQP